MDERVHIEVVETCGAMAPLDRQTLHLQVERYLSSCHFDVAVVGRSERQRFDLYAGVFREPHRRALVKLERRIQTPPLAARVAEWLARQRAAQFTLGEFSDPASLALPRMFEAPTVVPLEEPLIALLFELRARPFDWLVRIVHRVRAVTTPPVRTPSPLRSGMSPLQAAKVQFDRDLLDLLGEAAHRWVAYHGPRRVGAAFASKESAVRALLAENVPYSEMYVRFVEPASERHFGGEGLQRV